MATAVVTVIWPEAGSLATRCPVPPLPEWQGQGLCPATPHLAGIDATLEVASTEHLGLDLVPVEIRTVADIVADYGDSGLLEYPSLLAWVCGARLGRAGEHAHPLPSWCPPQAPQCPCVQGQEAPNLPDCSSLALVSLPHGGFPGRGRDSP